MLGYVVAGLGAGGSYALLGLGLTFTYRATRTVNFGISAMGASGALTLASLSNSGVSFWPGLLAGVAVAAAVGVITGAILMLWFEAAPVATRSVVTIAILIGMIAIADLIFGGNPQPVPNEFPGRVATIDGTVLATSTVLLVAAAVFVAVCMGLLLSRTLIGRKLEAVSERSSTAELLGIRARVYGLCVWAASGAFAAIAITLVAATTTTTFPALALTVIPALTAALCGLFRHLGWTILGGLALGVLQDVVASSEKLGPYSTTAPFFALLLILLITQRHQRWEDAR